MPSHFLPRPMEIVQVTVTRVCLICSDPVLVHCACSFFYWVISHTTGSDSDTVCEIALHFGDLDEKGQRNVYLQCWSHVISLNKRVLNDVGCNMIRVLFSVVAGQQSLWFGDSWYLFFCWTVSILFGTAFADCKWLTVAFFLLALQPASLRPHICNTISHASPPHYYTFLAPSYLNPKLILCCYCFHSCFDHHLFRVLSFAWVTA